ncbi:tetraspanin Tsp2 family [Rhizoctonia solani AG-1 IA]|uniref:Tetraspanin Tsp2 family n=1 Tax=Thanatephorus cucumeris (strain AG1-IA) TaxID=983506 RepID=L8WUP8_THACA|nr:tetraspanin Tsp2 family [Rhizoctonia solani AG-1 IA]
MGFGNHNHYYSGTSLSTHPHRRTVSSGVSGFTISAYTSPSPPPTSASPLVTRTPILMAGNDLAPPSAPFAKRQSVASNGSASPSASQKNFRDSASLSINYVPAKFSRPHSPGIHNRKGAKGAEPKRGGGLDAFGQGHNRMADRDDEDYEGVQFGSGPGWSSNKKPRLRWNRFKWILFILNILLTIYTLTGLIFCLLTWFNVWTHADIVRVGNTTELILSTVAASFGLLTSVIGWSGILLNNRAFLAVYTLFLWITFGLLVAPGYVTYKKKTFNLEGKINAQWSTGIGLTGRLRIQNQLHCCGYFSPYVEATISQTCYSRSPLPGCKGEYLRFERKVLTSWYTVAFALVPLQLACMVGSLLCANHVTYRFGKGMMPKAYRLDLNSMAVIMDNYRVSSDNSPNNMAMTSPPRLWLVLARIFRLTRKATGQFAMPRPRPTTSPRSLVREDMVRSLTQAATTTSADKRPVSILSHLYKFTTAPRPSSAIDKLLNMTCVHRSASPD